MWEVTLATSLTEMFKSINNDVWEFLMCDNVQIYISNPSIMHWFTKEENGKCASYPLFDKWLHIDETIFTPIVV